MDQETASICPSDGKPCTLKCYRGAPARPCDPVRQAQPQRQLVAA